MQKQRPFPDSYWVTHHLIAGEYPATPNRHTSREKLTRLLAAGVTMIVDLTEAGELVPYASLLPQLAAAQEVRVTHLRRPIRDLNIPTRRQMQRILQEIQKAIAQGETIYVHCWGGVGRTGTVVGCFLVEQGMRAPDAIATIARLRQGTPDGHKISPETRAQRDFIEHWQSI